MILKQFFRILISVWALNSRLSAISLIFINCVPTYYLGSPERPLERVSKSSDWHFIPFSMHGEARKEKKNLLFLPVHGRILGNAYGVGVSRTLNADLNHYWLNGDFNTGMNKNRGCFFGSPCPVQHQAFTFQWPRRYKSHTQIKRLLHTDRSVL